MIARSLTAALLTATMTACSGGGGGMECATSAECAAGRCINGECVTDCDTQADCDDSLLCNGVESCVDGTCAEGVEAADGTDCDSDGDPSSADFCSRGLCGPSRCGDGTLDTAAGEECDDGNSEFSDGCDDCRFSCREASDCDDSETCNGDETCDTVAHVCTPGSPLADETRCSATAVCMTGRCVVLSCMLDGECDDAEPCNGVETCVGGACEAGAPVDCDDGNACTEDRCGTTGDCTNRLIDADFDGHSPQTLGACGDDCDDEDPNIYGGAPDACDGIDNDCDDAIDEDGVVEYYVDCDDDGFAPMDAMSISSCTVPAPSLSRCATGGGWTTRTPVAGSADCRDDNPTVHPAQTVAQTSAIPGSSADVDFDYNCNGSETPGLSTRTGVCVPAGTNCVPVLFGWIGSTPECGDTGELMSGCRCTAFGGFPLSCTNCAPRGAPRTMSCL